MITVGINGFGRIGRAFFRIAAARDDISVVAINDLGAKENLEYLLKYDSVYGHAADDVMRRFAGVQFFQEKDPAMIPWGTAGAQVVVESTGLFTDYEKAKAHLAGGAKRVVISAPAKGDAALGATVLMGVNEDRLASCAISSNASCTTNASSPVIAILDEKLGIERALLNTTHSYTATQP